MLLKKLEIVGFKSFADKTDFVFEKGMTCIVGPNGCGKSNVVDSLKWVLGEQSAKTLRGNEMLDVVFSGTSDRPSQGMAEVSLTITNTRGVLPTEFDEVRITRRLYKSGDSEYLINGEPSRLRDVREMFMDTGVGKEAYSFIEQGKIDIILHTNPADRRIIFEEAAGISRYKAKRIATERKLERVEQNLVRLEDIIEEVGKHSRSIKRQAAKARRYRALSAELERLQLRLAKIRFGEMSEQQAAAEVALAEKGDRLVRLQTERAERDAEIKQKEHDLLQLERRISELHNALHEQATRVDTGNERMREARELQSQLADQRERHQQQIVSHSDRLVTLRDERVAAERQLEEMIGAEEEQKASLARAETERAELEQAVADARAALSQAKDESFRLMKEEADVTNRLTAMATEKRALTARRDRLAARREQIGTEREAIVGDLERLGEEKGHLDSEKSVRAGQLAELEAELATNRKKTADLTDRIVALRHRESGLTSKYDLFRDQLQRREGYTKGVRHIIESFAAEPEAEGMIFGTVADFIEVDLPYARAIEAALAGADQAILSRDLAASIGAVEHLKENQTGRATFVPLTHTDPTEPRPPLPADAIGWAADLVQADPRCAAAIHGLLKDTVLVKHLGAANAIRATDGAGLRLVTLEGDILYPDGVVEGGSEPGGGGLITQKSQMKAIKAELEQLHAELAELEAARDALTGQTEQIDERAAGLRREIEAAAITIIDKQSEITQLSERLNRVSEEDRVSTGEATEVGEQIERLSRLETEIGSVVEAVREQTAAVTLKIEGLESEAGPQEATLDQTRRSLTELKVAAAQATEKLEGLRTSLSHLERQLESGETAIRNAQEAINECITRAEEAQQKIRQAERLVAEAMEEKERLSQENIQQENDRSVRKNDLETDLLRTTELDTQVGSLDEAVGQLRLTVNEFRVKKEDLAERVREEHGLDITADPACPEAPKAEPAPAVAEPAAEDGAIKDGAAEEAGAEQAEPAPEAVAEAEPESEPEVDPHLSPEELVQLVEEKRAGLARIGNVNLEALDQLEELQLREAFLTAQQEDLTKARSRLQEVIRTINKTSRELFETTFASVQEHFRAIFRRLFGGGKADVFLEEGVDVLDAGIEIVARPPGKELRSITLLSGGEKVLTAIALLFAIFKSRPSPFCVLDEVDAALDDTNIGRFLVLLKDYLDDSQFLIITHNKQTMAAADRLYGITMEQRGVSKKVTVRFEDEPEDETEKTPEEVAT